MQNRACAHSRPGPVLAGALERAEREEDGVEGIRAR